MSYENAKQNLQEFGKELSLELAFDENHTCILGIDNAFSLHLTYEPNSDRLYLYSPVLDGLPKDDATKLKLYEGLLEGSMLGGQMAGGGVGVAVREELILMHCVLEMGAGTESSALRRFAPLFVEAVEKWRGKAKAVMEGHELPKDDRMMPPMGGGKPPIPGIGGGDDKGGPKPGGDDRFIKI